MLKKIRPAVWGAFMVVSLIIAILQPPFQTPDEFDHFKRAYLLSKGNVFLSAENGITGGNVDSGLLKFMSNFNSIPFHYESKISEEIKQNSSSINWSGKSEFSGLPNTAVYFPTIYIPQAFFITASEFFGLNVSDSYLFIKLGCILTTFLLFLCANKILEIPIFSMAFLVMPMALSLIASTHPEPFSYGLVMIVSSLFIKSFSSSDKLELKFSISMLLILFTLGTYRIYLLPLFLIPLTLAFKKKDLKLALLSLLTMLLVVSWILYASKAVVGFRIDSNTSVNAIANHSVSFINMTSIFLNTILNIGMLKSYLESFIGIIGWLDTSLSSSQYLIIEFFLLSIFVSSVKYKDIKNYLNIPNFIFFLCSGISFLLIFFILIYTVTKDSSEFVQGVQGRYFIPLILMFSYIFIPSSDNKKSKSQILLGALLILSSMFTIDAISQRFYISSRWNHDTYVIGNAEANINYGPLNSGRTFEQPFVAAGSHIEAARLKLATFMRINSGFLFFEIIDDKGLILYKDQINLNEVKDNDWFVFELNKLVLIQGDKYKIKLYAEPNDNDSITWWAKAESKSKGNIIIDGVNKPGTFVYQLLYKMDAS